VIGDIVIETRGFDEARVLRDAYDLGELQKSSINPTNPILKGIIKNKENKILDSYSFVKMRVKLAGQYEDALNQYISAVLEQGKVASEHANIITAYAESTPKSSTLLSAITDKDLQSEVLDMIGNKSTRERVEAYLNNANDAIGIVGDLGEN